MKLFPISQLFLNWAIKNNPPQWQEQEVKTRQMIEKNQILINTKTIREAYFELNQPEAILEDHRQYNERVQIRNEKPVGTQWVA